MDVAKMRDDFLATIRSIQRIAATRADTATSNAILDLKGPEKFALTLTEWNLCTLHTTNSR
jgi:hypothetical protein